MLSGVLQYETRGGVAWLTLDRPEKLNAMPRAFFGELRDALHAVDADEDVRAAIIAGNGRCFSVGGDIAEFAKLGDDEDRASYVREAIVALVAVEEATTPTVAAVHGAALGGGCELTMVCDIVVADTTARFGTPESSVGLIPGLGIVRGRSQLNNHWLKYMILTGATLDAEEARLAGLAQIVVPPGRHLIEAERVATQVASRSTSANASAKAILARDARAGLEDAVETVATLMAGTDFAAGIAAFTHRR